MIYLDHAATCPMRKCALDQMTEALKNVYGNASPSYPPAQEAKAKLDQARSVLAETIGADWREIFFTSGGTEGDNWALTGAAEAGLPERTGGHIITTRVEHHAVLHTCAYLESRGYTVSYLPVDEDGFVSPDSLENELAAHPDTVLVSVMLANNEVGTIEPVEELVRVVRKREQELAGKEAVPEAKRKETGGRRILFHTDAVQAYGKIPIDVKTLDVDLLSVSAHKIGGPKGVGFLYLRKGTRIGALIHGGAQESGRRAGTENVPAIIGFAAAAEEAVGKRQSEEEKTIHLQQFFREALRVELQEKEGIRILWNGPQPGERRLSGNVSVSFPGFDQRTLLINLDLAGICASGGSACTSGALEPSHVLMAMTQDRKRAEGTLRFTLGTENTEEEILETVRVLKETIDRISHDRELPEKCHK
ncbi:cysteine desulfurase family protein [Bacillota bacterium LCP21S3_D9]|nr:cysteine desulfurase [Bacillota bacterium]